MNNAVKVYKKNAVDKDATHTRKTIILNNVYCVSRRFLSQLEEAKEYVGIFLE